MEPSLEIARTWADQDVAELAFTVCDGTSQVVTSAYVGLDWHTEVATALATFAQQMHGGIYDLEAGKPGREFANGAFHARFHFHTPNALFISTFQQSDYFEFKGGWVASEAHLFLRTEPGLLDEFVRSLAGLDHERSSALLRCIPILGFL